MAFYRKKPVVVEAITFDELVAHGTASGAPLVRGMPWSFTYKGCPITHETDECYLVNGPAGTRKFYRGNMLVTQSDGLPVPVDAALFAATYELVEAP